MKHEFFKRHPFAWAWLLCVIPCAAIAATTSPLQKEIAAAKIHAQVAAHADSLKMAQLHLHHVINCMVGAHGSDYSAAAEALAAVPCTGPGLGNGAVADSAADPALHKRMDDVLQSALAGVRAQALPAAKQDADRALKLLDHARDMQTRGGFTPLPARGEAKRHAGDTLPRFPLRRTNTVEQRLDYVKAAPGAFKAMRDLQGYVENSGLEHKLMELVKMRASQINGCAHCLDMHSKDARAAGETEQRLYALNAWRETPFYTDRERAALAWTEALTRIRKGVSDELYNEVRKHFSEKEIVDLSLCIIAINGWNRLAIPFRAKVGDYQPGAYRKSA